MKTFRGELFVEGRRLGGFELTVPSSLDTEAKRAMIEEQIRYQARMLLEYLTRREDATVATRG